MFLARLCLSIAVAAQLLTTGALAYADSGSDCASPRPGQAICYAQVLAGAGGVVRPQASPSGYGPAQLRAAYHVPSGGSAYVAVVGAFFDPAIKSDLDAYSRHFGLPVLPTCSSASQRGCFARVDQRGGSQFGAVDAGWGLETALDVEQVHAMCSGCRIELVEADSASISNLLAAVDRATELGAQVVSMSWGGGESSTETAADSHFHHPGVLYVASSGDSGYGVSYPAASPAVLAVGGTHLVATTSGRSSETAWSGSGSGCSRYEPKPSWQHDLSCPRRSVADLAADADPATGASVYSSLSSSGAGWFTVGGTSLAAPLVAGMAGLAGGGSQAAIYARLYASLGTSQLFDITAGRNGSCGGSYLCSAARGYDGPTGVGALSGLSAL
jgi:subtilase family serine protease